MSPIPADPAIPLLSEEEGLSVFQIDGMIVAGLAVGDRAEGPVVKDDAVLKNFDEGPPLVCRGAGEDFGHALGVGVNRPGDKGRLGPEGE